MRSCPTCRNQFDAGERFCPRDGSSLVDANVILSSWQTGVQPVVPDDVGVAATSPLSVVSEASPLTPLAPGAVPSSPEGDPRLGAIPPAGPDPMIGRTLLGQFRIEAPCGEGAMGRVYRTQQTTMDRLVAVKILHQELAEDPGIVRRFHREARAAARLSHPNIVTVHLVGEDGGIPYIIMEYVDGQSLATLLRSEGALDLQRAVRIARQIASALSEAHLRGIVHRDLKPENIIISQKPRLPDFAKVLDFGVAKILNANGLSESRLTQTGAIFGTPYYISPEQASGLEVDHRGDLYSLGVVLFQMAVGRLPFDAPSGVQVLVSHIKDMPPRPRTILPSIPMSLERLILRALQKEPGDRFQDADEFGVALDKVALELQGEDISGHTHVGLGSLGGAPALSDAVTATQSVAASMSRTAVAPSTLPAAPVSGRIALPTESVPAMVSAFDTPLITSAPPTPVAGPQSGGPRTARGVHAAELTPDFSQQELAPTPLTRRVSAARTGPVAFGGAAAADPAFVTGAAANGAGPTFDPTLGVGAGADASFIASEPNTGQVHLPARQSRGTGVGTLLLLSLIVALVGAAGVAGYLRYFSTSPSVSPAASDDAGVAAADGSSLAQGGAVTSPSARDGGAAAAGNVAPAAPTDGGAVAAARGDGGAKGARKPLVGVVAPPAPGAQPGAKLVVKPKAVVPVVKVPVMATPNHRSVELRIDAVTARLWLPRVIRPGEPARFIVQFPHGSDPQAVGIGFTRRPAGVFETRFENRRRALSTGSGEYYREHTFLIPGQYTLKIYSGTPRRPVSYPIRVEVPGTNVLGQRLRPGAPARSPDGGILEPRAPVGPGSETTTPEDRRRRVRPPTRPPQEWPQQQPPPDFPGYRTGDPT